MKENYYSLQNTNRINKSKKINKNGKTSKRKKLNTNSHNNIHNKLYSSSHKKRQSNYRKRQTKKLNYKKVFVALVIIFIIFYLLISGIVKLFSKDNNTTAIASIELQKDITVNMAVIGDIMCHTTNFYDAYDSENDTYDFSKVFTEIKDYIQNADIAIGNLETTFAGKDVGYTGYPTFNTPEQLAQNLVDLGLDVVSTANNHSLDKRYSGLVSTLDELDKVRFKSYWNL